MGSVPRWAVALLLPFATWAQQGAENGKARPAAPGKPASPTLPAGKSAPLPAPKDEAGAKRRDRMKARDAEIDRMLKEKNKQPAKR